MTVLTTQHARCARCNRKVRVFPTRNDLDGLWEYDGKNYGYHCYQIVTGQIPDPSKRAKYHNPEWDKLPLPF